MCYSRHASEWGPLVESVSPFQRHFIQHNLPLNCSPRLLISPLNCTHSSLCHRYLDSSGQVDTKITLQCASNIDPCCTFVAGGMPSAYMIRLHNSVCRTFRSIIHLDPEKPAVQWEEGLEIQWTPPTRTSLYDSTWLLKGFQVFTFWSKWLPLLPLQQGIPLGPWCWNVLEKEEKH